MKIAFVFYAASVFLLTGCSPSTPLDCNDQQVKSVLIDRMKHHLATKTSMLMQHSISASDLSINIESIETVKKDKDNPFYRKCEMSFTMPGMMFSSKKTYEIDKNEEGDLIIKFTM